MLPQPENDADLWKLQVIDGIAVLYPPDDLFPHDKLNGGCRCRPDVEFLSTGRLLISHKMCMRGHFLYKEPKPAWFYQIYDPWRNGGSRNP